MASRRGVVRARRALPAVIVVCVLALSAQSVGASGGGVVLPPGARPHGVSLADMAKALALFSTSGNDPARYPSTPLQVLYYDPHTLVPSTDGCGSVSTGTNVFVVKSGTTFFVPVENVDDSPPVLGTFPTTRSQAGPYFFDPSQVGGRDFVITVDGVATPLGASYLAGPVTTAPLLDGGGSHMITLGAFLGPMSPGTHTVSISGGLFGALIQSVYSPTCFFREAFTYTVKVVPRGS